MPKVTKIQGILNVLLYLFNKIAGAFANHAPLSLEVSFLIFFGLSVNGLIVLIAAAPFVLSLSIIEAIFLASRKDLLKLFKFVDKVNPANFEWIPADVWLEHFKKEGINLHQTSSFSFRRMCKSLKILAVKDQVSNDEYLPVQIVTFPTLFANWIFLPSKYEKMNGFAKFQLLHELGHLNMIAVALNKYDSLSGVTVAFFTCLFVFVRGNDSFLGSAIILVVIVIELVNYFIMSSNKLVSQIADEMEADHYAFRHAKPEWFKKLFLYNKLQKNSVGGVGIRTKRKRYGLIILRML